MKKLSAVLSKIRNFYLGCLKKKPKLTVVLSVLVLILIVGVIIVLTSRPGNMAGGMSGGAPGGMQGGMPGGMPAGQAQGGMNEDANYALVKTVNPYTGDISTASSIVGEIEAEESVRITAKASGEVTAVYAQAGDMVSEGDIICEIDTGLVESAKNSYESAQISYDQAKKNMERMEVLYLAGDITEQEHEQYENNLNSSKLQFESAELNYNKQLDNSVIKAPISGKLETVAVDVYDNVNNNQEICAITGDGDRTTTFYVTERIMKNLENGDAVSASKNGIEYAGKITQVSSIVDSTTGMFRCAADIEGMDNVAVGSSVKIELTSGKSKDTLLVPVDAIYYSGGDAYLYTVVDGLAKMTSVEVGLYNDEAAEIISGVTENDIVISTWSNNLYEGAKIRVLE